VYITYGPPDEVEHHSASATETQSVTGAGSAGFPYEVWRYRRYQGAPAVYEDGPALHQNGHELMFRFVDYCRCGDYRNTSGWPPLYEQAPAPGLTVIVKPANRSQARFKELEQIATHKIWLNQVPFLVQADFLKLTDYTVLVPITVQVRSRDLTFTSSEGVERATLQIFGRAVTSRGHVADTFEDTVRVEYPAGVAVSPQNPTNYRKVLPLSPGEYWLDLVIKDVSGDKVGSRQHRFVVAGY
jgi:hypothetical protein